ncbi:MAG: PAS domain S-box protein [Deltaproteobacteria bacterium]|nr:PAS domain S-box protein [Deltaproteobacteria bacterium]
MPEDSTHDDLLRRIRTLEREARELKQAEKDLEESERSFRTLVEETPMGISIMRADFTFEYFNPKFSEIFGYTLNDIPDRFTWFEKAYPDKVYRERVIALWRDSLADKGKRKEKKPEIFSVRCKNGASKIIHFRPVSLGEGRQLTTYEDITAFADAQKALRESEEKYKTLYEESKMAEELYRSFLHSSADAIAIYDLDGRIRYVSPAFTKLFGWTLEEVEGKKIPTIPPLEEEKTSLMIRNLIKKGIPYHGFETKRIGKDGRSLDVSISASRYDDHEGNPSGIIVTLRDISERKRLEAQLLQAHKMEAIGTLAGGIAHDFNNILQTISGYTQILLMGKEAADPDRVKLEAIETAAMKASDLTKQLLVFSQKVESELRPLDLNQEVKQVSRLLERTIAKMITIELDLGENLKIINADPVQVEQILMNLAVNARDAMPDGGTLAFQTRNVVLDEEYCKTHLDALPGEYVRLVISDTGHGMAQEVLEHLFEPFFTTKELGRGTGLGLAMVYGIVKNHEGHIACSSESEVGTTFEIHFPVLKAEEKSRAAGLIKSQKIPAGTETVLLVDDEKNILEILQEMLARFGYSTLAAESGERAVEIFEKEKERIDLVILDLSMPGMGGQKCLGRLLELNPRIKVIIASGYSANRRVKETLEMGATAFIAKPYHHVDLLKKVREVCDETRPREET